MKTFIKYFFSICLILISGYGVLNAHALLVGHAPSIAEMTNVEQEATLKQASHHQSFISLPESDKSEKHFNIEVSNFELNEDDVNSEDDFSGDEKILGQYFHQHLVEYFAFHSESLYRYFNCQPLAKPERIYVLFRVFRI